MLAKAAHGQYVQNSIEKSEPCDGLCTRRKAIQYHSSKKKTFELAYPHRKVLDDYE
jgi:hypothetical protein